MFNLPMCPPIIIMSNLPMYPPVIIMYNLPMCPPIIIMCNIPMCPPIIFNNFYKKYSPTGLFSSHNSEIAQILNSFSRQFVKRENFYMSLKRPSPPLGCHAKVHRPPFDCYEKVLCPFAT